MRWPRSVPEAKRRGYNASLGRFLSPDTLVPTSTQGTQAWDRYAFVNNNPVRYTDPTGHTACNLEPEECEYLASLNGGGSSGGRSGSSSGNGTGSGTSTEGTGGGGGRQYSPTPIEGPLEWLLWLTQHVNLIWNSGPNWLFTSQGHRILTVDAPHGSVDYYHLNTDIKFLQDSLNHYDIESTVQKVAETAATVKTVASQVKTGVTGAFETLASFASDEVFFFLPLPAGIFRLPGQTVNG